MWGLPPEAMVDDELFFAGIHSDDRPRVEAAIANCINPGGDGVYEAEYRVVSLNDGTERWVSTRGQTFFDKGVPERFIGTALDVTERKRAERTKALLIAELQHRVRNTLAVIRAIARRTAETSANMEEYVAHFDGRLNAFARTQTIVTSNPAGGVDLAQLVTEELLAYRAREGEQLYIAGPSVRLQSKAAETFGLAVHELATNAVKHGALSSPSGQIAVTWCIRDGHIGAPPHLLFEWIESGSPRQFPRQPRRRGFGTELLERTLNYEIGAKTSLMFKPDGLHCNIEFPMTKRIAI